MSDALHHGSLCKVKPPKTTYPRSSYTQGFAGGMCVYINKNKKIFCCPLDVALLRARTSFGGHICPHPTAPSPFERQQHLVIIWGRGISPRFSARSFGVKCSLGQGQGELLPQPKPRLLLQRLRQLAFPTQSPKMGQGEAPPVCAL